jgi:hypothetical protein
MKRTTTAAGTNKRQKHEDEEEDQEEEEEEEEEEKEEDEEEKETGAYDRDPLANVTSIPKLVRRAIDACNPHRLFLLYDAVMRASNRRFALGKRDTGILRFRDTIYRYIDMLPEDEQLPFAKRLAEEASDCSDIARDNRHLMQDRITTQSNVYCNELYKMLKLCMKYELPLRRAWFKYETNRVIDNEPDLQRCTFINEMSLRHDNVHLVTKTTLPAVAVNAVQKNECYFPRTSLCIMSVGGTIIKWVARALPSGIDTGTDTGRGEVLFVLPPLCLRSIIAAEKTMRDYQVYMWLILKKRIGESNLNHTHYLPPKITRIIGRCYHNWLKKKLYNLINGLGISYYPRVSSSHITAVAKLHRSGEFNTQQHTRDLINFSTPSESEHLWSLSNK